MSFAPSYACELVWGSLVADLCYVVPYLYVLGLEDNDNHGCRPEYALDAS
jgi:hypothetical protein